MTDYYWIGGDSGGASDALISGNWSLSSGGTPLTSGGPDDGDVVIFDSGMSAPCQIATRFPDSSGVLADFRCLSTQDQLVEFTNTNTNVVTNKLTLQSTGFFRATAASKIEFRGGGTSGVFIFFDSANFATNPDGFWGTTKSNVTLDFGSTDANTAVQLENGVYPNLTFVGNSNSTTTFSPTAVTAAGTNTYPTTDILNFTTDSDTSVVPATKNQADLSKVFRIHGNITAACADFNWGNTTLEIQPQDTNGSKVPYNGVYSASGNFQYGTTAKIFKAKYNHLRIAANSGKYFEMDEGAILSCNKLTILPDARFYGPDTTVNMGAEIQCVELPTILGDWNFSQIAEGIYRTRSNPPPYQEYHSILANNLGSNGQVLAISSSGELEWSSSAGGGGVTVEEEGSALDTTADTLNFTGNGVVASGTGTTKTITITDTNTTYGAGSGIGLSGTTFSVSAGNGLAQTSNGLKIADPATLSQLTESTDSNFDKFLLWDESTSTWKYMLLADLQDSIDTNTNQLTTFDIGVDTNTNATTISHGETLTFTGGTGITTETTADGTVTITSTVTDTNTQLTQEQVEDFVDGVLVGGTNLTKTYDDAAGTLTLDVDDAFLKNDANDATTGTITAAGFTTTDGQASFKIDNDTNVALRVEQDGNGDIAKFFGTNDELFTIRRNGGIKFGLDSDGAASAEEVIMSYTDINASERNFMSINNGTLVLQNRGPDGDWEIRGNSSTAGSSGETTIAKFQDTVINLYKDTIVGGNLTVNGTTTTIDTATLTVEDPLISLASGNDAADTVDIGFYGLYDTSGSQDLYAGLFRDANDSGKFKLFKDLQTEPTTTVDTAGTGYTVGTLVATLEGNVTGNLTGNADTATTATNVVLTDNESTDEDNAIVFGAGGDVDGSTSIGLESDGDFTYNPSSGLVSAGMLTLTSTTSDQLKINYDGDDKFALHVGTDRTKFRYADTAGTLKDVLTFKENGTSIPRVGVNQINPETNFHVGGDIKSTSAGSPTLYVGTTSTNSQQANLTLHGARNAENTIAQITFSNIDDTDDPDVTYDAAKIIAFNDGGLNAGGLYFQTVPSGSSTTLATAMTITENSSVGIGTTSPAVPFHVAGGNNEAARFEGSGNDAFIKILEPTGSESVVLGSTGGTGFVGSASNNNFAIRANNSNKMFVTSAGNVGIGTSSPTGTLTVTSAGHDIIHLNRTVNNVGYGAGIIGRLGNSASTSAAHEYAAIFLQIEDNTDGSEAGSISFNTSSGGTAADQSSTNAMQITSAGRVGIGTTSPSTALDVAGDITGERLNLIKGSGYSSIEMSGPSGAFIDMKNDSADDYDVRFLTDGTGLDVYTNGAIRMKVEDDKIQLQEDLYFATGSAPTIHGGAYNPLTVYGNSDGTATSTTNNVVTRSTAAAIDFDVNASQQLAMSIRDNKDVYHYGVLSGPGIAEGGYGANSFYFGDTGSDEDDDWYEVFRWTPNNTMSATNSNQYKNFAARFQVVGRGIQRINFDIYVRGEYGVQDSNGWWTREFIIDGLDETTDADGNASPDGDSIFLMVYNAGTSLSMPYASLYMRRDEDWEIRTCNLISMYTNCVFEFKDSNVGETTPTNDSNTGSYDVSPSIRRKLRVDANNQVINGVGATGIYFDDTNDRLGIGESSPLFPLHLKYTDNRTDPEGSGSSSGAGAIGADAEGGGLFIENLSTTDGSWAGVTFRTDTADARIAYQSVGSSLVNEGQMSFFLDTNDSPNQYTLEEVLRLRGGSSDSDSDLAYNLAYVNGRLGVGTSSPSTELHVSGADHPSIRVTGTDNANADPAIELLGTADNFTEGGQLWYDNGSGVLHLASLYNNNAADIQFHTKTGADRSTSNVRMTIAGDGNIGIGTTSPTHLLHLDHNATNPDTDGDFAIKIDHDSTGSASTTGDREQGGLYVDADSNATGGDQSNEHRLYGVWSDTRVNESGDPDAVYAVYGYSEDQRSGTSGMTNITNLAGGWFIGASDANNSAPAISTLYGLYGSASIQDTGTINNAHSLRALTTVSGNRAANANNLRGVSAEIDIGGTRTGGDITINWARVFEAVFDHNATDASGDTAVVTDGYLYYGDYAVSQSDQVTNKWGLYINDEDKNYISGNLGIGTTSPDAPLHVEHSSGLIAKFGEGNVETRMQFADARAMIGYQGDHAIIQGGSGGKGVSINVNNGTFGSGVALRVTSDADVGIGTTSPGYKLDVAGTGRFTGNLRVENTLPQLILIDTDATNDPTVTIMNNAGALSLRADSENVGTGGRIEFTTSGTERMRLTDAGRLGIGTTSPGHLLEVAGGGANGEIVVNRTSGAEILLQAQSATGVIGTSTNHNLDLKTNGSTRMRIENGGDVGIGTTSPGYKLDVNGSIRAVDDMYTDKLIASEGIRSSSRASFNTMQMYFFDRQNMGTQAVLLRTPVGGSSTANPSNYFMPHSGVVMQVMMGFYAQTLATSGTDTWSIIKTDTNGIASSVDFDVNFANLNRIGTTNSYNILIDISVLADASNLDFVAGDMLQIQRTDSNPISIGNCKAQLWVTFDI